MRPIRPRQPGHIPRNRQESRMVNAIDDLAVFEELRTTLIPQLRKAIESGADTEEILKIGKSAALARLVSIAVLEAGGNLPAIKEILDRLDGKVAEKKEVKLGRLKDEELDALVNSKLAEDEGLAALIDDSEDGDGNG